MGQNISLCKKRINKPSLFFLWESDSWSIIYHEIYQLLHKRKQLNGNEPHIVYGLTPIIQDTYITR